MSWSRDVQLSTRDLYPCTTARFGRWRCRVWRDNFRGCWTWEARRFKRNGTCDHLSGDCRTKALAKRVARIVAEGIGDTRVR